LPGPVEVSPSEKIRNQLALLSLGSGINHSFNGSD